MNKIAKLIFQTSQMSRKKKTTEFYFTEILMIWMLSFQQITNHLRTRKMSAFMQCFQDLKKLTIIKLWQREQNKKLNIIGISATLLMTWYMQIKQRIFCTTTIEDKGKSTSAFLAAKFKSKHTFSISVIFAKFLCFE